MSEQEPQVTDKTAAPIAATKDSPSTPKAEDAAPKKAADKPIGKAEGDQKPAADAGAQDGADKGEGDAPAEIALNYPEALGEVDPTVDAQLREFAKEAGLSQELTDKGVAVFAKAFEVANAKVLAAHEEAKAEHLTALKEQHGKAFAEKAGAVKAFLQQRGGDDLVKFLDDTGGSTVPLLFNFFDKIAGEFASAKAPKEPAQGAGKPQRTTLVDYNHPTTVERMQRLANQ